VNQCAATSSRLHQSVSLRRFLRGQPARGVLRRSLTDRCRLSNGSAIGRHLDAGSRSPTPAGVIAAASKAGSRLHAPAAVADRQMKGGHTVSRLCGVSALYLAASLLSVAYDPWLPVPWIAFTIAMGAVAASRWSLLLLPAAFLVGGTIPGYLSRRDALNAA
jgi:hypothetical protein